MIERTESIFPEQYRILSGSALKIIAVTTMIIDHVAHHLLKDSGIVLLSFGGHELELYEVMRMVGRLAFPIFVFLIVEGFKYTRNRFKYGRNMLVFALISEIPWNLEHTGTLLYDKQNVFFTLFFGYLCICLIEKYRDDRIRQVLLPLAVLLFSMFFRADYGATGVAFIIMMYATNDNKVVQLLLGSSMLSSTWKSGLAFIPINLYNGKRGFITGKFWKYAFYAIYPVHITIIWLIKFII